MAYPSYSRPRNIWMLLIFQPNSRCCSKELSGLKLGTLDPARLSPFKFAGRGNEAADNVRPQRQPTDVNVETCKCVLDCIDERRNRADDPALPDTLEAAFGIERPGFFSVGIHVGNFGRSRQQIIHQRRRQRLSISIITNGFTKHAAER